MTQRERQLLESQFYDPATATDILFKYWTLKEAYTKALGMGMGFDFSRVEYRIADGGMGQDRIAVDNVVLQGWSFRGFSFRDGLDHYVGMVAQPVDDREAVVSWSNLGEGGCDWIEQMDAVSLLLRAKPIDL